MEDVKRHICSFEPCQRSFTTASQLEYHLRTHAEDRPFVCEFQSCGARFSFPHVLAVHKRQHSGAKPYICPFEGCPAAFKQSAHLDKHKLVHTQEKVHNCDHAGCGAAFGRLDQLQSHSRKHSGARPYKCDFEDCGKSFGWLSNLKVHLKIHLNIRTFLCDREGCNAKFIESGALVKHKQMHAGIKPFACTFDGCNERFTQRVNLKVHMYLHTGERPHRCQAQDCDAAFTMSHELKRHIFHWHTVEGQVRKKQAEGQIFRLLQNNGILFKEQHHIDFTCMGADREGHRCFIDFLIEVKGADGKTVGFIFLEVDEQQHTWYNVSCELRRMTDVHRTLVLEGNTFPVIFIRYNPHAFSVNGRKRKITSVARQASLINCIKSANFERPFSVQYMYYDVLGSQPQVFKHPEYDETFKSMVTSTIY